MFDPSFILQGPLKQETMNNVEKYVIKDGRLPTLLDRYAYVFRNNPKFSNRQDSAISGGPHSGSSLFAIPSASF